MGLIWAPSRADYRVVRYFPALRFDVTKVSLPSRIEHQKLSFGYRSRKRCMYIAVIFVTDCFISVERTFDDVLQCYRNIKGGGKKEEKKKKKKKTEKGNK